MELWSSYEGVAHSSGFVYIVGSEAGSFMTIFGILRCYSIACDSARSRNGRIFDRSVNLEEE